MATNKSDRLPRGSNPPYVHAGEAFAMVREIYESAGGTCGIDMLSQIIGNSPSSSSFTKKIGSLKNYGLIHEPEKNRIELTPIGYGIAAPVSFGDDGRARKQAFLNIEFFARAYERHKGKLLPADEFLKNIFEQEIGVPRELSNDWISSFKQSAHAAGLLFARTDGKTQILETPIGSAESKPPMQEVGGSVEPTKPEARSVEVSPTTQPSVSHESGHTTKIALSGGRFAVFSIPDSITARDGQKLKSALAGLTSIIDSLIEDSSN
jgi:hypothetical protein